MEEKEMMLKNHKYNLSDFALFLSVVKNPNAYRCMLSVFLDEPDIELSEVKAEQVILNKLGKRAIRLDAWAKGKDNRQFNMEMQNNAEYDDVRKRSRFYQGLMDSPILKSGKETKYKYLPSTVIIFITQDDIFGKDVAKYTFSEQCEEISGLKLDDGTKKIFLNMTSKNGTPELVSMLQYIKDTRIDNPEIQVTDERILELDHIVTEVKSSEEWEAVQMNILEIGIEKGTQIGIEKGTQIGIERGLQQGLQQKLKELVKKKVDKGYSIAEIADILEEEESIIQKIVEELKTEE